MHIDPHDTLAGNAIRLMEEGEILAKITKGSLAAEGIRRLCQIDAGAIVRVTMKSTDRYYGLHCGFVLGYGGNPYVPRMVLRILNMDLTQITQVPVFLMIHEIVTIEFLDRFTLAIVPKGKARATVKDAIRRLPPDEA